MPHLLIGIWLSVAVLLCIFLHLVSQPKMFWKMLGTVSGDPLPSHFCVHCFVSVHFLHCRFWALNVWKEVTDCVRIFSAAHPQHVCLLIVKPCTLCAAQHAQVVCMQVGPSLFSSKVAVTQLSGFCPGQKIYIKQHCVGKTFKRTFYLSHSVSLLNQVLTNQLFWNPGGGHKSPRPALDASQPQPKIFLFNFILSEFLKERLLFAFFTWTCTTQ